MSKILKLNEYMVEEASQIKLAYTPKQIVEMASQAIVSAEKMEHTSMFPIYGEMDNPSVYLAVGYEKEYANEKGNKKINTNPKNIESLVKNLYNASNNAAANGYSGCFYEYEEI